jgi:Tol biopolymer transport system component
MIRWRYPFLLMVSLALIASSHPYAQARAADEKVAQVPGRIAFFAGFEDDNREGKQGLYVVDPSTDVLTKMAEIPIKNGPIALANFRLSPDGQRIAYGEMKSEGGFAVYTSIWLRDLRPDAEPRKISDIAGWPIWSPDGKQLLVLKSLGRDNPEKRPWYEVWRIDDDGSHPVRLPIGDDFQVEDWSRDGRWLVGISRAPGKSNDFEIIIMHLDGTSRRSLTGPGQRFQPRFSPDGRRVAFVESSTDPRKGSKGKNIGVVDLDGKDLRRIYLEPDDTYLDGGLNWSPDGKSLVTVLATWTRIESGAVTPLNPRLCNIDAADGRVRFVPHPPSGVVGHPQWR